MGEQTVEAPTSGHMEEIVLSQPANKTAETGRMTTAADQAFRERLGVRANSTYHLYVKNPGGPEARHHLKQARDTFIQAGSPNRAIEMQEELLLRYPEPDPYRQLVELASLKKTVGELDDAISVLNEAVNLTPGTINKLNGMRRVARYREQRLGPEEGLRAWWEVEQYADSIGQGDSSPAQKAREKIERLERSLGLRP